MPRAHPFRHRLLTIVLLGVLTSALSLAALVQLLKTTTSQRVERARDALVEEALRIAKDPSSAREAPASTIVGMRGGVAHDPASAPEGLPDDWSAPVRDAIAASASRGDEVAREAPLANGTLVVVARPAIAGGVAWTAYAVRPLASLQRWQTIVLSLVAATLLLCATAVYQVLTVKRGAAALQRALDTLATDLAAPIPRPEVRELGDVADGIARLAENLARAHAEEERLGRELANRERLAALGRVVAGVAHEIRNPLASIKLRLDLAATGDQQLPAIADDAIAHASSEIARLDRLVADMLVVSGRSGGPRADASLGALLRARVEALSLWAGERGVTVTASGDARAKVDKDSLARAIDNLLRNAVDASPRGGRVEASVQLSGKTAIVRVDDHGEGIAASREAELFEPFFTTKPDGTGLGLALSRAIARAHGGEVSYERVGAITRFELALPGGAAAAGELAA